MKFIATFFFCCFTAFLYGQQTVSISAIAAAGNGSAVSIKADDLKVEINGKAVRVISVTALAGHPLQYVLINDQSGSTRWPQGLKQQADVATQLLKQVIRPGSDVGSLVNFAEEVYIDVLNSGTPDELAANLVRNGYGGTALYDAVLASARYLAKQPSNAAQRKVIFLFCDGQDNASRITLNKVTEGLLKTRIPVFIIAPASVESKKDGAGLRQLAADSGGRAYFLPDDTRNLNLNFIKQDLDESFLLTLEVSSFRKGKLSLKVHDANSDISILAPSQVFLP